MVRSDIEYKNYEEGKYPPPEERESAKDFPSVDELLVYGVDIPCPETEDDLRCPYYFPEQPEDRDDVKVPTIHDLHGYKVPPYGLTRINRNGGGMCSPKFIYGPGVFFEDMFGIEKALGPTNAELIVKREEGRKNALVDGAREFLEDVLEDDDVISALASLKDKDNAVIKELTKLTLQFIYGAQNPKEMRLFLNDLMDRLEDKDESVERNKNKLQWTKEQIDKVLELTDGAIKREREDNIIDIGGDEW